MKILRINDPYLGISTAILYRVQGDVRTPDRRGMGSVDIFDGMQHLPAFSDSTGQELELTVQQWLALAKLVGATPFWNDMGGLQYSAPITRQ